MSVVTHRTFTCWGRFGNQLLSYSFLKTYCRRHGATLQIAPWVGEQLFGTSDPHVTEVVPDWFEKIDGQPIPPVGCEVVDHNFNGYGQYHTSWYRPEEREFVKSLFPVTHEYPVPKDGTLVCVHIRRGDYGWRDYPIIPTSWYLKCLDEIWPGISNPVLFIATEDRSLVQDFARFNPITTDDLGVTLQRKVHRHYRYLNHDLRMKDPIQLDFYPDWAVLREADILLGPNSTYSFTAAMLGNPDAYYRASLTAAGFTKIDPWNDYPLLHEMVDDFPHLEGIKLDANPNYW